MNFQDAKLISTGLLRLSNISRDHRATYACVVSNAVGSAYSTVNVDVEWPPSFIDSENESDDNVDNSKKNFEGQKADSYGVVDQIDEGTKGNFATTNFNNTQNDSGAKWSKNFINNLDDKTTNVGNNGANVDGPKNVDGKGVTGSKSVDGKKNGDVNDGIKIVEVVKGDDAYLDCSTDAKPVAKVSQNNAITTF